jgi:uncharacterized membrane protein
MREPSPIHDNLPHTMQEAENQQYGVSRIVAFSDAVFAFAITLLILTIPYPAFPASIRAGQFFDQLILLSLELLHHWAVLAHPSLVFPV